jgi:FAD/FMN-containing dehydrogenase
MTATAPTESLGQPTPPLPAGSVADLRAMISGGVFGAGDGDYDASRAIWNGMIDRRPALIVRCVSVGDVQTTVAFAAAHDRSVTVRGGGHGVAGTSLTDGGIVCDLSGLKDVTVDVSERLVRADGGCTLGDLDKATQAHGLAVPVGVVTATGVAGLTLSGGMGWLRHRHGLTCDNLITVDIVTADGSVTTATNDSHPELLWAARGGGGVPGVVTAFTFRAHRFGPQVQLLFVMYPGETAVRVLRDVDAFLKASPRDIAPVVVLGFVPAIDDIAERWHGAPMAIVAAAAPDGDVGAAEVEALRTLAEPIADFSRPTTYCEAQSWLDDDYPSGDNYYWKSLGFDSLDHAVDDIVRWAREAPSRRSTVDVWFNHGAILDVAAEESAYGPRSRYLVNMEATWDRDELNEPHVQWARDGWAALAPASNGTTYLNFPGLFEEGDDLRRAAHGSNNHNRLTALRRAMDPQGRFA